MLGCEYKALFLLLTVNFLLQKAYGNIEESEDNGGHFEMGERIMTSYVAPAQHPQLIGHKAVEPSLNGVQGATPVNSLLIAYLESKDAKRTASSMPNVDHYVRMLMDGLLEEWRPLYPHTDAEALQMVRDFLASRDVNSDMEHLKPEHANHEQWRERLKHLLFHYVKQPTVKQHPGLQRALRWYLNKLKHTIWVRRRLSLRRLSINRMNLLFSYLQALDHAVDQREYRFDIYKEINKAAALRKRLLKLSTSPEVKMNAELTAAFNHYISKLTEALEETKKHTLSRELSKIPIQNMPLAAPEVFPKKITSYVDIVQDFIERKKATEYPKHILDGQSLDKVGGIRTFLEYYLTTVEVKENATLTEAINTFMNKLKRLPSHHLLDRHLKRETIQKMVTKYEVVYEYLSKLEWKRSGSPVEILQQALENPEIQNNATLVDAINFYLQHSPKDQQEEVEGEEAEEEAAAENVPNVPKAEENAVTSFPHEIVDRNLDSSPHDLEQSLLHLDSSPKTFGDQPTTEESSAV